MIQKSTVLWVLVLIFCQCSNEVENSGTGGSSNRSIGITVQSPLLQWQGTINTNNSNLTGLYLEDAVLVKPDGIFLQGAENIAAFYGEQHLTIDTAISLAVLEVDHQRGDFEYEIIGFTDSTYQAFRQLVIWQAEGDQKKRSLEFTAPYLSASDYEEAIATRRAEWIKMCNQHDATVLVEKLYAPNALYYNHKPMVVGRQAIIEEYDYMNNPEYELNLSPLVIEAVNENIVFELGQCSGSYGGKYVLIWQKNAAGEWYVLLDSNL